MADYNGDLKVVINQQAALIKKVDRIEEKIDPVCDMVVRHDEKIETNKEEIKSLRNKSDKWNAGNTAGLAIAYLLSAFGIHEAGG